MKPNDLNNLIESSLFNEVKKRIIKESQETLEMYQVTCEGEPVQMCETEEEAEEIVNKLEKEHPGKQFIIEKKSFESYDKMLDELDNMGEELQEKENQDMKSKPKVKSLAEAILLAKKSNKTKLKINEQVYDVEEMWKKMEEEETCEQCNMEEDMEDPDFLMKKNPEEEGDLDREEGEPDLEEPETVKFGPDYDNLPDGETSIDEIDLVVGDDPSLEYDLEKAREEEGVDEKPSLLSRIKNSFNRSLSDYEPDYHEKFMTGMAEGDGTPETCSECGSGELNEEGQCNECGSMKESTKKKLRLKESDLVSLIGNMVTEAMKGQAGIPGIPGVTVTKRAQTASKKENTDYAKDLSKKLKDYLSFDGNDNPEFPKPIGKGDKMAYRNTSEKEKKIEDNRGETNTDLTFDHEPTEEFKNRVKKALEGDSTMGNSSDAGNVVKDEVGKKIVEKKKRKVDDKKKKKDVSWGHSWIIPADVDVVAESKNKKNNLIEEEIKKINKLSFYNKKTQ